MGFAILLLLASSPETVSFPQPFDAIGSVADEELTETTEDRFIARTFDFYHDSLYLFLCSCILFAIVLGQQINLEILNATNRPEMADDVIEQMKKIIPFVTELLFVKMSAN